MTTTATTALATITVLDRDGWRFAHCTEHGYLTSGTTERDALQACEDHDVAAHGHVVHRHASTPVAIRCDSCNCKVSNKQADKYDAFGVDWALCTVCERA